MLLTVLQPLQPLQPLLPPQLQVPEPSVSVPLKLLKDVGHFAPTISTAPIVPIASTTPNAGPRAERVSPLEAAEGCRDNAHDQGEPQDV